MLVTRHSDCAHHPCILPNLRLSHRLQMSQRVHVANVAEGKQRAAAQYKRKRLKAFHIERWDLAHRATDYDKWATAKDFYDIEYEHVSMSVDMLHQLTPICQCMIATMARSSRRIQVTTARHASVGLRAIHCGTAGQAAGL
jgi:hypothetical protein